MIEVFPAHTPQGFCLLQLEMRVLLLLGNFFSVDSIIQGMAFIVDMPDGVQVLPNTQRSPHYDNRRRDTDINPVTIDLICAVPRVPTHQYHLQTGLLWILYSCFEITALPNMAHLRSRADLISGDISVLPHDDECHPQNRK